MLMTKSRSLFFFDAKALMEKAQQLKDQYQSAEPFPHVVMDHFLPEDVLDQVLNEFPVFSEISWSEYKHQHSFKYATSDQNQMGEMTRHLFSQFNSSEFLVFLEKLTAIEGLIADPYLWGGGLHLNPRGGYLNVHADFNWYEKLRLDRRLNLLLYLNKNWKEEYAGHIQLWSRDMRQCVSKVLPIFNRCVIFSTSDYSYHGLPDPIQCPEGEARKSLALYYYSNGRPQAEGITPHNTLYHKVPGQAGPSGSKAWGLLGGFGKVLRQWLRLC